MYTSRRLRFEKVGGTPFNGTRRIFFRSRSQLDTETAIVALRPELRILRNCLANLPPIQRIYQKRVANLVRQITTLHFSDPFSC